MAKLRKYSQYKCPACERVVVREDSRPMRKSFCVSKEKNVMLKKVRWVERRSKEQ